MYAYLPALRRGKGDEIDVWRSPLRLADPPTLPSDCGRTWSFLWTSRRPTPRPASEATTGS